MKKYLLFVFSAIISLNMATAQKPLQARQGQPLELKPLIKNNTPSVPEAQKIFQGSTKIKTIPYLRNPASDIPKGFKVITSENGLPTMISGQLPTTQSRLTTVQARSFQYIDVLKTAMQVKNPTDEFLIKNEETDEDGVTHVRMAQQYKGIPVWGGEIVLHERGSQMYLMNGIYFPTPSVEKLIPAVSEDNAGKIVQTDLSKKVGFKNLNADNKKHIGGEQLRYELVIFHVKDNKNAEKLAWHITSFPNVLHRWEYFIDAQTGAILDSYESACTFTGHFHNTHKTIENKDVTDNFNPHNNLSTEGVENVKPNAVMDGAAVANAVDLSGATRQINTYQVGTTYYMIDASRTEMYNSTLSRMPDNPIGVIETYDYRNTDDGPAYYVASPNNTWTNAKAVSAHYNAAQAYLYFKNKFNRKSINGRGGNVTSFINVTDESAQMDNAYWNGEAMFYGNGDAAFTALPKALDVAGHELSHGVIQNTANLRYQGESGALNESFADIFGAMIDRDDWKMGEDVVKDTRSFPTGALRDLSNPYNGGTRLGDPSYQPKFYSERYTGTQDNGGVHINSGIVNYAFFLFASNASVGKDKAEQIYYTALTKYLVASSKFIDLRAAIEQVCKDRNDNAALTAAQTAFTTVGIGAGGSATGAEYQKDVVINPGQDWVLYVSPDNTKLQLIQVGGTQISTLSTKGVIGKPSVTDDGTKVFFVGKDKRIYQITINWSAGTFKEDVFDDQPEWNNVAVSRDGSKLAVNALDSLIYIYSFTLDQTRAFKLYNPTTAQGGLASDEVEFSDVLEWDHFGESVMYDAKNTIIKENNTKFTYWDIGFMNVWSNTAKTWAKGEVFKLFSSLPEDASVGNPTFAKNSPYIIAFDYIVDNLLGDDYFIYGANIESGDLTESDNGIFKNNTYGVPSFTRTDDRIMFTNLSGSTPRLVTIPLQTNKIDAKSGTSTSIASSAQIGNWFSNGKRVISATKETLDERYVTVAPNPFNNHILIDIKSDKSGQATVQLFDVLGKNIASYPLSISSGSNTVNLPTSSIQAGVYLLKINMDGKSLTRKVMKL